MWFESITRSKVNLDESELIPIGNAENAEKFAEEFGCKYAKLIRNTLSSMPIYFMSLFGIPSIVKLRLEQIQKDILW